MNADKHKQEMKTISIFGSSAPRPGDHDYEWAETTGRLLAQAGAAIATGGYMGTMEAASKGAAEVGGRVIGVACNQIERFRQKGPNPWVNEVVRYETLRERVLHLVTQNDGMIVLPGGIGTISEMTLAWSLLQVGEIPQRPLVLLGDLWRHTMTTFIDPLYVHDGHAELISYAATPEEAVIQVLRKHSR
jgi:uncharacterized protein (TIGR00730 family)